METPVLTPESNQASDLRELRVTEVRGPNVVQIRRAVLRFGGETTWNELMSKVSVPCRLRFERPMSLYEWVEECHFTELSQAYLHLSGRDDIGRAGASAAQEEFTTLHRWMLKMMTPGFLISSLPRFFAHYHRGGRVVVDDVGPGHARISLWADGFFPEWFSQGMTAWTQRAMELTGAQGVFVVYEAPPASGPEYCRHVYRLAWRA